MDIEKEIPAPCVVWNADKEVWELPSANDLEPGTLPSIAEVIQKIGSPVKIRYPGHKETVEIIH
jgi:hypothetical protein